MAGIRVWLGPVNITKPVANTVGIIAQPTKPWIARNTTIDWRFHANAHATLASVNPAAEIVNSQRVEKIRVSQPESGIIMTSATRYEVCTDDTSSLVAASPAWISASELVTIWMSISAMNIPNAITRNASMRAPSLVSLAGTA